MITRTFYSDENSLEYQLMKNEQGWNFYKILKIVPQDYKNKIETKILHKDGKYTLYEIIEVESENNFFYINFNNKKEGFLRGQLGDPKNSNSYICSSVNISFFNEFIKNKGVQSVDSIEFEYLKLFSHPYESQSVLRINSLNQMRILLEGTSLKDTINQDTINLSELDIDFNREKVYWLQYKGFFKFKFFLKDNFMLEKVGAERIGVLDAKLLTL